MGLIINLIISTIAVFITASITPGVQIKNLWMALVTAVVLGILNAIVKPILVILTLPATILSLGLFLFVINAVIVLIASKIVPDFYVKTFWSALLFSLILTVVGAFLHSLGK